MYKMILVLNADYLPLTVASFKKGTKLLFKGKADLVTSSGLPIVTDKQTYERPSVIRLKSYINKPFKKIPLTRQNIFKRDGNVCGYCPSKRDLTIDHIIPKSRGGSNNWDNLVTCCGSCNRRKDDRTPNEAKMFLKHKPTTPSGISLLLKSYTTKEDWKPYMFL